MIAPTIESEVRSYCRSWPVVFDHGRGSRLFARDGRGYLDFFAGAGALNYGHNHPVLKRALLDYLARDGVTHSLDMLTAAKQDFLTEFASRVLGPRRLDYRVQFPGPTGANSVEAALKLARKVTGRHTVVAFTRAFHGMSLGSLAVTGNATARAGAGVPLGHTWRIPYDGFAEGRCPGSPCSTPCSPTAAAEWTSRPLSSWKPCRVKAASTRPARPGSPTSPKCAAAATYC